MQIESNTALKCFHQKLDDATNLMIAYVEKQESIIENILWEQTLLTELSDEIDQLNNDIDEYKQLIDELKESDE